MDTYFYICILYSVFYRLQDINSKLLEVPNSPGQNNPYKYGNKKKKSFKLLLHYRLVPL